MIYANEVNYNMHNMKYQYKNHLPTQKSEEFAEDLLMFAKIWFALPEKILTFKKKKKVKNGMKYGSHC